MNRELWEHQAAALDALKQSVKQGVKRIILQAPTGSGKTLLAAAVVDGARVKGNKVAFVVPAISLVDQTVEAFYAEDIRDVGVIQANHLMTDWSRPIQVCSIQTIRARKKYPEAQVVVFDECHVMHETHKQWLTDPEWQHVPFIGLSATPWRKGLGQYFQSLLVAATTKELIEKGFLSPFRVFATGHPDLRNVKTVAGDYHEGQLSTAMQEGSLSADIVRTWLTLWGKGNTLCFGVDCAHAQSLQARFQEAGVSCGYQDAQTPSSEREEIKRKFHKGELRVVTNVGTLTTGVDWDVRCLILARPTKSEILYTQIIGRALRTAPGKADALILDHSDTTMRLGFVTDIHYEHLDDGSENKQAKPLPPLPKECPQCHIMKPVRTRKCPNCGFETQPVNRILENDKVDLVEVTNGGRRMADEHLFSREERTTFYQMLLGFSREKNYKDGWAGNKYREKFGCWPSENGISRHTTPLAPSTAVRSWIKSRQIAWIKGKQRNVAHEAR